MAVEVDLESVANFSTLLAKLMMLGTTFRTIYQGGAHHDLVQGLPFPKTRHSVNTIQKCHRVCKAEVSPQRATVAKPDRAETLDIAALAGFAGTAYRPSFRCSFVL